MMNTMENLGEGRSDLMNGDPHEGLEDHEAREEFMRED
jgi:hypothetical protein